MASLADQWPLEVVITPAQSSFFAGEELKCLITFTNHNVPVPASQPLPSTSRFPDNGALDPLAYADQSRRIVSTTAAPPGHSKSQSFDFRKQLDLQQHAQGRDQDGPAAMYDADGNPLPARKRLIGRNATLLADQTLANGRQGTSRGPARHHAKSASVADFSPAHRPQSYDRADVGLGRPSNQLAHSQDSVSRDASANWSSIPQSRPPSGQADPRAFRKASAPIQRDHPHSRKKSVIQVQNEDLSASFELSNDSQGLAGPPRNTLYASQANASEVSLVSPLDTPSLRDSVMSTQPVNGQSSVSSDSSSSFYNLGGNETMDSVVRDHMTDWSQGARAPNGLPPASSSSGAGAGLPTSPLFPQRSTGPPGSETVLWTFAQFGGNYEIDESLIKPAEFEDVKRRLAFGDGLASPAPPGTPRTMGGGDLGQGEDSTDMQDAAGWTSYLRGALGSSDSSSRRRRHMRTGSTMLDARQKTMTSKTIPLFATPPSIVAVDLTLLPGQSKTYSYSLRLPTDIPPSFFGKSIKFNYELVIGTNRIDRSRAGASADNQRSRLIKVPLRVYNHVNIAGAVPFFDLGNPIVALKDDAKVQEVQGEPTSKQSELDRSLKASSLQRAQEHNNSLARKRRADSVKGRRALTKYTLSLLASCPVDSDPKAFDPPTDLEKAIKRLTTQQHDDDFNVGVQGLDADFPDTSSRRRGSGVPGLSVVDDDGTQTCKGAVEILSRNSQKVSYDISKDGQIAAVLTLTKSRYRLGDTVLGVVAINKPRSVARVVRVAAVLECHEEIESTLSTMLPHRIQRMTRKVHAEHHSSTLDVGQSSFSLPIPSGATPDFSTSGVKLHWTVRLSFLTQMGLKLESEKATSPARACAPHVEPATDDGYGLYHSSYRAVPHLAGSVNPAILALDASRYDSQAKLEIVECAVPIMVLPNSTSFRAGAVSFKA